MKRRPKMHAEVMNLKPQSVPIFHSTYLRQHQCYRELQHCYYFQNSSYVVKQEAGLPEQVLE